MVSKIDVAWDLFLEGKISEAKKLVEQDFSIDACTDFSLLNLMGYLLLAEKDYVSCTHIFEKYILLAQLNEAVETIKKTVVRDELVGYLAVGIDKNGNTVQTCCGTSFVVEEMLADLFKELIKNNKKLGEAIFERLGTQLDKPKRNEPKDNSNDNEKSEEEVIKNIMDLLLKSLDIDPEGL
nr:MAG TPA: hypothetical protein [Caudoviricetes sp.]